MIRSFLILLLTISSILVYGQQEIVFFQGQKLSGKVELSRLDKFSGTVSLLSEGSKTSLAVQDIDSIHIGDRVLYGLGFVIGPQQYYALGERFFAGEYDLYLTKIESYGEIVIVKSDESFSPLFEHNANEILSEINKEKVQLPNYKRGDLVSYSKEYHEKNGIKYKVIPLFRFIMELQLGARGVYYNTTPSQVIYTSTEYSQNLAFLGSEIFSELVLGHMVIMPSFRTRNYSFLMDHYDFGARGGMANITIEQKSRELGLSLKYRITQGRFLNPYISLGFYRIVQKSFETGYEVIPNEDEEFEVHSLVYHRKNRNYPAQYGIGVEKKFGRSSLSLGATFFSYQSPVSMDCTYSTDTPDRFEFLMKGKYDENGYFLHLDLAFSLYRHGD